MRIYTRVCWDMTGNVPVLISTNSRQYIGPWDYCKGPSAEQKALAAQQQQFYSTLQANLAKQFEGQTAIFNGVKAVYDPILAAGPGQFGYTAPEEAALRTQASEGTAAEYRQASQAAAERMAARGGGNTFLPSGVEADITGKIAGAAAESEAGKQLGITESGYAEGKKLFDQATNVEMGVAAGYNPLGWAGAANTAGVDAFNSASEIQKMKNASSPWGTIGGLVGGLAGSFLGPIGSAAGSKIGGMLGNAGSVNSGGIDGV